MSCPDRLATWVLGPSNGRAPLSLPFLHASSPSADCLSRWNCGVPSLCLLCHYLAPPTVRHYPTGYETTFHWGTHWPSGKNASVSYCWVFSAPMWPSLRMPCACVHLPAPLPQILPPHRIHLASHLAENHHSHLTRLPAKLQVVLPHYEEPRGETRSCLPRLSPLHAVE